MIAVKVFSWDSNAKKTATKTFNNLDPQVENPDLVMFVNSYAALTNGSSTTAETVTTEALDLE